MTRTVSWPTIFPSRLLSAFYCLSLFPMTYSVSDIVSTKLPYFLNQRPESFSPTAKGLSVKHYPSDEKTFCSKKVCSLLLNRSLLSTLFFFQFELLCCVQDDQDPAINLVHQLKERYPKVDCKLFVGKS